MTVFKKDGFETVTHVTNFLIDRAINKDLRHYTYSYDRNSIQSLTCGFRKRLKTFQSFTDVSECVTATSVFATFETNLPRHRTKLRIEH